MTDQTPSPQSVVVPVEPTEAMLAAWLKAAWPAHPPVAPLSQLGLSLARSYRAMLAAAPAPSSLAGGEVWNPYQITPNDIAAILDENADCSDHGGGLLNASQLARKIWDAGLAALSPEAPAREGVDAVLASRVAATMAALAPRHEAPAEGAGEIALAARALLDACYKADENSDLSDFVDGTLLTRLDKALRARSSAPEAREGEAVGWKYEVFGPEGRSRSVRGVIGPKPNVAAPVGGYVLYDALFTHPAAPSADKLRTSVEALEKASRAISAQYALAQAEYQHLDTVATKHDKIVQEGRRAIREALAALKAEGAK